MHRTLRLVTALALTVAGLGSFALAYADGGDVSVALTAHRILVSQGKEARLPAEQAKPGDVIEYRATYSNRGASAVRDLEATLPVPAGLEYLPKTAQPVRLQASLDGKTFAPAPLTRRVKLSNGKTELREVPASEYRALRWSIGLLGANSSRTVGARMRVAPLEAVATVVPAR
jgi:uncharacterized repeat protein (TIGR01451 family)